MRLRAPIVAVGILACVARMAICNEPAATDASPVVIEHQGVTWFQGAVQNHHLRITLVNRNDRSVWFAVPGNAEEPLPESGTFVDRFAARHSKSHGHALEGYVSHNKAGDGQERSVVQITFYGTPTIHLFHLPPQGRITLTGLLLLAGRDFKFSEFKGLTVLEANELLVNGKTPIEEWLPYNTLSDAGAEADRMDSFQLATAEDVERLKRERLDKPKELPKEPVDSIQATHIRSWTVHFQPPFEVDRHGKPVGPKDGPSDSNPYAKGKKIGPPKRKKTASPNP